MIYLFDRTKKLQKIIPRKHINSAKPTVVRNGIYQLAVEVPLFYETKQGTHYNYQKSVSKAEFAGHYDDKGRFQLYKIYSRNITANEQGEFLLFDGVHIFFDEAKAMGNIHDRRFRDSEAKAPADAAFNSIGWTVIDYDVTDRHDINFYRASITDAWNDLISTYGVEFDYELQFDGRKIISKNIIMKKQIGRWTGQRFAYGTNVLTLTQEQDESEVYTAAVGRGRGEESGDGFGPRLEFGDIAWSKDGITKPVGQNYIELPSATAEYGFIEDGVVKPRIAPEVIFEDIEDKIKLADATYYWLLENCLPKATWKTEVARIGNLKLGDTVGVLYKAAGIIKRARVEKIEYNLLDPELSKLTLGDFHHFENRQMKRINAQIKRLGRDSNDRITRIKNEWNAWIDNQFTAAMNQFEQNLIDQQAEIEADRENMTNLIEGTRTEFTDNLNAEITQTKEYAEQQAQEKAEEVRTDLETVTSGHQEMLDSLKDNVMNIDDFIGPRDRTLQSILDIQREELEQKIEIYNRRYPNLVIGTTLENIEGFEPWSDTQFELRTNESLNYIRTYVESSRFTWGYHYPDTVYLEQGKTYTLAFDFRSDVIKDLDYTYFMGPYSNVPLDTALLRGFMADGEWHRYYITFNWINTTRQARLLIGTNRERGDTSSGWFDTRQIHVYEGDAHDIPWSPSPSDNSQIVSQLLFEMRQLEDGMSTLATKTEVDLLTGNVTQLTNEYQSTSEQVSSKLQNLDDVLGVNGSHFTQIAEQVQSKVWLNDVTDINPNLIPFADVSEGENLERWKPPSFINVNSRWVDEFREYVVRSTLSGTVLGVQSETFEVVSGEDLTLSFIGRTSTNWNSSPDFRYTYLINENGTNQFLGSATGHEVIDASRRRSTWKFKASFTGRARVLIGTYRLSANTDARFSFKEPKLERGNVRTPFLNAFSNIEQLANKIALQVQEIDGEYLSQSDVAIQPDYVQIGAQRIGGETIGAVLRVSPTGIDMVAEAMRLSGDLYVDGDITALAIQAIEGNFARLFANQLTANVITADHIQVGTVLIDKMFATSARIDQLITKTHFVNEMHTLTLNVVDLNASQIRTRLLSANTIEASWIKSGTALLDRVFSSTAMFERMMAKSAFVTTLSTVTLDLHELTIWRPDGVPFVMNGMERFGHPVPVVRYIDDEVETDDKTYWTNSRGAQVVGIAYGDHAGRYYNLVVGMGLRWDSDYATQYCNVQIRTVNSPTGVNIPVFNKEITARRSDGLQWHTLSVPLGRPTYGAMTFQIEIFRRGENVYAPVEMRYARSWISA
ncbi:phage tail spike protein [Jeotgalicoccus halotolerans]|uniref:Phage minor structural protein n=1 Tax=Jeotgalicoccus halotolerans TaxID=157227 RepID=A0A3E0AZZ5_9STAP|nr:phage tail spike protein [Jeotgalicoccus halotolerans]REG25304.1 phage minor structural protein [Jeotgalicoccus halotolerans]